MIRFIVSICVLVTVLWPSAAFGTTYASKNGDFTFYGSGWGHGIGMSQYGAYGLARRGWSASRIAKHYYSGTTIETRSAPVAKLRVGLLQASTRTTLVAQSGSYTLRLAGGAVIETVPESQRRHVVATRGRYEIFKPDGTLVGGRGWGSVTNHLLVERASGAVVRVAEWGHALGRGHVEFNITGGGDAAHVVAVLHPEQYLYGLGEMPSSWPQAALQIQAIAGRTYAYRRAGSLRSTCNCHLYSDPRDQAYVGWDKESGFKGEQWVAAVDATARHVLTYAGSLIEALYSSSSGGFTEDNENVWSGTPLPYLRGRCDPGDYVDSNPNRTWSVTLTAARLGQAIGADKRVDIGDVVAFKDYEHGVSGRVKSVTVVGTRASVRASGWDLRRALGLKDTRFSINRNLNVIGPIRARYDRELCRPGLAVRPQRSVEGGTWQAFRRGRIYRNDARARVTWLRGRVNAKYVSLGAHRSFLRLPYALRSIDAGRARRARFGGGDIFWTKTTGAHELHGPVLKRYLAVGGWRSALRYPDSDVVRLDDARVRALFQGGRIVCNLTTDRCRVRYSRS